MTIAGVTIEEPPLLSLESVTLRFGTTLALDDASLFVRPGTVHALLGENGAGKTTLMRVAFGMLAAERVNMRMRGAPVRVSSPAQALAMGIGMVHQHFTLVSAMTVAENVALGQRGLFHPTRAAARVREVAAHAGLALDPDAMVHTLPVGAQQRCEIVKALARDVQLLILDEPTAVLAPSEAVELLQWLRRFADAGHAVVLITHKLRDALAVADDVTVLRRGRTVLTTRAADTTQESLARAMFGEDVDSPGVAHIVGAATGRTVPNRTVPKRAVLSRTVLVADNVGVTKALGVEIVRNATLRVHAGEIVGVAAIEGAGQHELLRVLAGRLAPTRGHVTLPATVGFVPEDRHRDALLLDNTLDENIALRGAGARRGRLPWASLRHATADIIAAFDVRASGVASTARALSGGNQQKLVLGRELADQPEALVVENPTRGLDLRATTSVHSALRAARDAGTAVVLYASDIDEVLALSDRVFVMHNGVVFESDRHRDIVGQAMLLGAS